MGSLGVAAAHQSATEKFSPVGKFASTKHRVFQSIVASVTRTRYVHNEPRI